MFCTLSKSESVGCYKEFWLVLVRCGKKLAASSPCKKQSNKTMELL